jgi:hypothetical protein
MTGISKSKRNSIRRRPKKQQRIGSRGLRQHDIIGVIFLCAGRGWDIKGFLAQPLE